MSIKNIYKVFSVAFLLVVLSMPRVVNAQVREVLDWNFFKNDRPSNGEWQAFTWYNINYRYRVVGFDGERANLKFDVTCKMDTAKSYFESTRRLKNDVYLLKHEQGHADIAYIYAVKLRQAYESSIFMKSNYRAEAKAIFDRIFAEMRAEQAKYDDEVGHGKDRKEQERWNSYFTTTIEEIEKARKL